MDWKDIKPLSESEALKLVSDYYSDHGFSIERVDTDLLLEGQKSPDLVGTFNNRQFLCEVKTPAHIYNEEMGLYLWSTTFNKLRNHIKKAAKQFADFDKIHKAPRIVAFTSNHPQLNWTHLQHNILGAVKYGNTVIKDFRGKSFVADTNSYIQEVDIFLWFQVNYINRSSVVELAIYQNEDSKSSLNIPELVSYIVPYKEERIKIPRYSGL